MLEKRKLFELLRLEGMQIATFPVLVGHGFLQHGRRGWCPSHGLRPHTYLISASYNLKDVTPFAYSAKFAINKNVAGH